MERNSKGQFKKKMIPWNKGTKGLMNIWNKGLTKKEIPQLSNSGVKKGTIPWNKGKGHPLKPQLCECGCGQLTSGEWNHTTKKYRQYIQGHQYKEGKSCYMYGKKHTKKTMEKICGENSPQWKGGLSFEPYGLDFNKGFKEKIRNRDNYCCIVCNIPQEKLKYKLCVHHVDYNKKNNFYQNCVSLCRNCHSATNSNRIHWKTFFQSLLKERYDYQYTTDQKIILDFTKGTKDV